MPYKYSLSVGGFDFFLRKKKETKKKNKINKTSTYYRLIQAKLGQKRRINSAEIHQKRHILTYFQRVKHRHLLVKVTP